MTKEYNTENGWVNAASTITTEEIDKSVMLMKMAREKYDKAKKEAAFFHVEVDAAESKVLALLEQAGKTKYHVDDLGTVNIINKYSVKVPKETTNKQLLFDWISAKYGVETLQGMLSIHSATLNSFVNEQKEKNSLEEIPGLDAPTHEKIVRFTSQK
jgi:hypothetical protein